MAALLHDRGAFAVILTDDNERAAGHTARGEIGECVRGDVGADGGLKRDRAAQWCVDRGGKRGGGSGFGGAVLKVHAKFFEDVVRVSQHIHQMRNWRTLVACHVGNARFKQGFGDRQNAFAAKHLACAEFEFLYLFGE